MSVDILNLADTAIDICDGRALDAYGEATRQAVVRISDAGAVLIGAPVYRASFPAVLKNLLDIAPVEALQNKPVGIFAMGGSARITTWRSTRTLAGVLGLVSARSRADRRLYHRQRFQGRPAGGRGSSSRSGALTRHADRAEPQALDPAALGPKPLASPGSPDPISLTAREIRAGIAFDKPNNRELASDLYAE